MSTDQIQVGKIYHANRPAKVGIPGEFDAYWNDRSVLWISQDRSTLQYDSPAVKVGRRQPSIALADFAKWAGGEVLISDTDPNIGWRKAL